MSSLESLVTIEDTIELENIVFGIKPGDSLQEIQALLSKFDRLWVQNLLIYVGEMKPFCFPLFNDLILFTGELQVMVPGYNEFVKYLYLKQVIPMNKIKMTEYDDYEHFKTIEEYENPINKDSIFYFIKEDDITKFVDYVSLHDIDIHSTKEVITINQMIYTYLNFACLCGSVNILKYLLINNVQLDDTTKLAILTGGSEEVLQFIISTKNISFDDTVQFSIFYHHNSISKWILENYKNVIGSALIDCIQCYNTEMFLYFFIEKGININDRSLDMKQTSLHQAALQNDIVLIKFLIDHGIDKFIFDINGKIAKDLAISEEARNLLEN